MDFMLSLTVVSILVMETIVFGYGVEVGKKSGEYKAYKELYENLLNSIKAKK